MPSAGISMPLHYFKGFSNPRFPRISSITEYLLNILNAHRDYELRRFYGALTTRPARHNEPRGNFKFFVTIFKCLKFFEPSTSRFLIIEILIKSRAL